MWFDFLTSLTKNSLNILLNTYLTTSYCHAPFTSVSTSLYSFSTSNGFIFYALILILSHFSNAFTISLSESAKYKLYNTSLVFHLIFFLHFVVIRVLSMIDPCFQFWIRWIWVRDLNIRSPLLIWCWFPFYQYVLL